jgi:hypothetical protein
MLPLIVQMEVLTTKIRKGNKSQLWNLLLFLLLSVTKNLGQNKLKKAVKTQRKN